MSPAESIAPGPAVKSPSAVGSESWESFDGFTATADGTYTITCAGGTEVLAAPPVSVGGILAGVCGIFLGVGGGVLGVLLLVVGLILFFVGRG